MACHRNPDCRLVCEDDVNPQPAAEPEPESTYSGAAGGLCPVWDQMDQELFLTKSQLAWCEAYDLSPETCWCLTNERSIDRQVEEYTKACESEVPDSVAAAIVAALKRCNALPTDED